MDLSPDNRFMGASLPHFFVVKMKNEDETLEELFGSSAARSLDNGWTRSKTLGKNQSFWGVSNAFHIIKQKI